VNDWICMRCGKVCSQDERHCRACGGLVIDDLSRRRLGTNVGNYRLHAIIGRGGMGTVYKGEHVYIGKPVAVKILHQQFAKYEEAVKRFLREARAASQINHPNIVDVTDFGPTPDGGVYFVMEYIEGESLEDFIAKSSPVALHRAINIVNQLAMALARAHELGVVHRDLKPENIMLASRPGRRDLVRFLEDADEGPRWVVEREQSYDLVKILDFGIAKVLEPELFGPQIQQPGRTMAGAVFGTPEYMSPESAAGLPVDHRSDIYSVGVIFYDLLVGHVPFEAVEAKDVMWKQMHEAPVPPRRARPDAEITEAAERLILRALQKKPDDRQQTMDELRQELQSCYGSVQYRRDAHRFSAELRDWLIREEARAAAASMAAGMPPPLPGVVPAGTGPVAAPAGAPRSSAADTDADGLTTDRRPRGAK
jgi:serine/threonine-protein kinase